jgi:hypothetical protein
MHLLRLPLLHIFLGVVSVMYRESVPQPILYYGKCKHQSLVGEEEHELQRREVGGRREAMKT